MVLGPGRIELRRAGAHAVEIEGALEPGIVKIPAHEAGDLNGDGRLDFAFSEVAFVSDNFTITPGRVYVAYGKPGREFLRGPPAPSRLASHR